jgi:hypothetical protein
MRFTCWITKATDTYSEYVIFIAFPWKQLLHQRASMIRYSTFPVLVSCLLVHDPTFKYLTNQIY